LVEKWQRHPAADLRGYKPLLQFTIFIFNKSVNYFRPKMKDANKLMFFLPSSSLLVDYITRYACSWALNTTKNPVNFCSTYLSPVPYFCFHHIYLFFPLTVRVQGFITRKSYFFDKNEIFGIDKACDVQPFTDSIVHRM